MNAARITLFQYEFDALLQALRRDLRNEQIEMSNDTEYGSEHFANARMVIRLLEALCPRSSERAVADRVRFEHEKLAISDALLKPMPVVPVEDRMIDLEVC